MKSERRIIKIGIASLLMASILLSTGVFTALADVGDIVDLDAALEAGADYVLAAQADITEDNAGNGDPDSPDDPDDGGWNWVLTDPNFTHSTAASSTNLYGATAQGLYYAYLATGKASYKTAMDDAASYMITDSEVDSAADLIFLMNYNDLPGVSGTAYQDAAKAKYDARVAGVPDPHTKDGAGFAEYVRDVRAGQGYEDGIIAWDIGSWAVAADMLNTRYPGNGYDAEADNIAEVIYQDSFNDNPGYFDIIDDQGFDPTYTDKNYYWYTLGITGLIDAFEASGTHTDEIPGLVSILLDCQYDNGAFSYSYGANADDEDWQSTAYAVMSLARVDQAGYQTEINYAAYWLAATQDPTSGGWVYDSGNHYPEVGGESTAALYFGENADQVWVDDDYCEACGNDGRVWGYDAFATIQNGVDGVTAGGTVEVLAGSYTEDVTIAKALTLNGPQAGAAVAGRTAGDANEATITGEVTLDADNITLDGFTITNPSGKHGIYSQADSHLDILNNFITDVGSADGSTSGTNFGLAIVSSTSLTSDLDDILIDGNSFSGISGGVNKSATAMAVGWTNGTQQVTNLVVQNNVVSDVTSDTGDWPDGHGAYGLIINNGAGTTAPQILDNSFSNLEGLWSHAVGLEGDTPNAVVTGNSFSGIVDHKTPSDAIGVFFEDNPSGGTVSVNENLFDAAVPFGVAIHPDDLPGGSNGFDYIVDATYNWWGDVSGPSYEGPGTGAGVGPNVDYSPWWGDSSGSFTLEEGDGGEIIIPAGTSAADIQTLIDSVPSGTTIILPPEVIDVPGGFTINNPGITLMLSDGTIIQASSPCVTVNADNTTITSAVIGGGVCQPSSGDHGILTGAAVDNLVIEGIEFDGSSTTGDGIQIGHDVNNLQILDNFIHDMGGDGIEYASGVTVSGVHDVEGNLFAGNTGDGINNQMAASFDATYNAWNHYDGPLSGDGVTGIDAGDYTPWNHVELSMAATTFEAADKVGEGYTITYTVYIDAQNVSGADFDLNFDKTKLRVNSVTNSGSLSQSPGCDLTYDNDAGEISFCGYGSLTGQDQALFEVVFEGLEAGSVLLDLDAADDVFSGPTGSASSNIYASALNDGAVEVFDTTDVTGRIDLQGRADDAGAVMAFAEGANQGYGPYTSSTSGYWGDVSVTGVVDDTYQITVSMDLYLDVTAASGITVDITDDDQVLNTLVLLGGDANDDDQIELSDAAIIGSAYGTSPGDTYWDPEADINGDGVINILDLTLMGGNYLATSADAYDSWTP